MEGQSSQDQDCGHDSLQRRIARLEAQMEELKQRLDGTATTPASRRGFRFSFLALILAVLISGPLVAWAGPPILSLLREWVAEEEDHMPPVRVHGGII